MSSTEENHLLNFMHYLKVVKKKSENCKCLLIAEKGQKYFVKTTFIDI